MEFCPKGVCVLKGFRPRGLCPGGLYLDTDGGKEENCVRMNRV